jgi:hypothetical protein
LVPLFLFTIALYSLFHPSEATFAIDTPWSTGSKAGCAETNKTDAYAVEYSRDSEATTTCIYGKGRPRASLLDTDTLARFVAAAHVRELEDADETKHTSNVNDKSTRRCR